MALIIVTKRPPDGIRTRNPIAFAACQSRRAVWGAEPPEDESSG